MNRFQSWANRVFLSSFRPYLWVCLLGFAIYARTIFFGFTYLDDNGLILDNYYFLKSLGNIFAAFREKVYLAPVFYRPILTVSFILDAQISGIKPYFYHFTNILFHLIASGLVCKFLLKLKYKKELAFFFSLVFVVHPALTQAVAWIPGKNDSLLAIFFLTSFIFLLDFLNTQKWKWYTLHMIFFALALFTKEVAILLPVICIFYLQLIYKEKLFSRNKATLALGWIPIIILWFFLRSAAIGNPVTMAEYEISKSVISNLSATLLYFGKTVFPFNLSVLPSLKDSTLLFGIASIILISMGILFSSRKRLNYIAFGILWFLLLLVPTFMLVSPKLLSGLLEHRLYLPLVGLFIILLEIDLIKKMDIFKPRLGGMLLLLLMLLSLITFAHSGNFRNKIAFWESAVETSPGSPKARHTLGQAYQLDGLLEKAEKAYQKSLELNPNESKVHNNLGTIYQTKGLFDIAESEYKKELEVNPEFDVTYFHLGSLYYQQKRFKEAEEMWIKAIEINPEYILAYRNLAVFYYERKDYSNALRYYNEMQKRGVRDPKLLKSIESLK